MFHDALVSFAERREIIMYKIEKSDFIYILAVKIRELTKKESNRNN